MPKTFATPDSWLLLHISVTFSTNSNKLSLSLQGSTCTIFKLHDKINTFCGKLHLWISVVSKGNISAFQNVVAYVENPDTFADIMKQVTRDSRRSIFSHWLIHSNSTSSKWNDVRSNSGAGFKACLVRAQWITASWI